MIEEHRSDENISQTEGAEGDCGLEKMIIKKKRENFSVQIRNSKKKQILNSNRVKMFQKYMKEMKNEEEGSTINSLIPQHIFTNPEKLQIYMNTVIEGFKKDYENYDPNNYSMLSQSLNHLRQLSSIKLSTSILIQIIESNIHPILISLISSDFDTKIRHEAAWLLTNFLASTCDAMNQIIQNNYSSILGAFTSLYLIQDNDELFETGIWGITNLCVDFEEAAESFYKQHGFSNLEQKFIIYQNNVQVQENLAWMMTVFSQHQKMFDKTDVLLFLKLAEKQVMQTKNAVIQHYGIRILYQMTINDDFSLAMSKRGNFIDYILLLIHNSEYINYIIGIMGNIIASSHNLSNVLLQHNILEYLSISLDNVRVDVRKEAMWCISNLLTGEAEEIQIIFEYNRLMEKIFRIARIDSVLVISEVVIGLSNCLAKASNFQIMRLLQLGILEIFVSFLNIQDVNITIKTVQGIGFLLDYGENIKQFDQDNPVKSNLKSLGFNQIIQSLQYHPDMLIIELAHDIIVEHYSDNIKHVVTQQQEDCEI